MSDYHTHYDEYVGDGPEKPRSLKDKAAYKRSKVVKAFKLRKDNKWDEKFTEFVKLYSNQYPWEELNGYEDAVVPNMIFSTVSVIVPALAVHSPKINVSAQQYEEVQTAKTVEGVVNHYWRELDVQDQVREAVKDFVIMGHGWAKVTWETETEERELDPLEWQDQVRRAVSELETAKLSSPLSDDEFPSVEEVIQSVPRTVNEVVRDSPRVSRVSPFDMIVDPDALRLEDARWIAQRSYVPLKVAQSKEEWDPKVRRKLKASTLSEIRDGVEVTSASDHTGDAAFVCVYEYYDLVDGTVCTFADKGEGFLVKPEQSPFPDVHPFVFIANHDVPERFFPIGDVEMIYSLQLELAMCRSAMLNDRKHGRRIYLYRSGSLGEEGVDALEGGEDRVMIDVLDDRPFGDVFQAVHSQGLHPEWYAQSEMLINDINTISGVSEYARGQMPDIRRTATEAGLIQDAVQSRSADKQYKVEQMMDRIAEKMIKLAQMFLDSQDVAKIVSDDMVVGWVPFDRQAIQGEFTFEVEAGSSQPQNESFRRQSALQLMDAFGQFLGTGYLNDQKFLEHILRNGFSVRNAPDLLGPGPQPDPMMDPAMMGQMPGEPPPAPGM